jgi:hypothetical protein
LNPFGIELHLLAQDFRVEERFGLDSLLPVARLGDAGEKPSAFVLSRAQSVAAQGIEPQGRDERREKREGEE